MTQIDELIAQALGRGPDAQAAVPELVTKGVDAIAPIIETMRKLDPQQNSMNLQRAVLNIRDARLVPLMIDATKDDNIEVVMMAFSALGQSHDARALEPLLSFASDSSNRDTRRSLAADALGTLGEEKSIHTLLEVTNEAMERDSYDLALSAIIALAKLGNHTRASAAIELLERTKDPLIRPRASQALQYVVTPDIFGALQKVVRDKQVEVRLNGIHALFYLGLRKSVEMLICLLKDKNQTVRDMAHARIIDLAGELIDCNLPLAKVGDWLEINKENFSDEVCFRLGKPIWLPDITALLEERNMRERTVEQLIMITGVEFAPQSVVAIRDQDNLMESAEQWWSNEGQQRFKRGHLYKWGYEQDLRNIVI